MAQTLPAFENQTFDDQRDLRQQSWLEDLNLHLSSLPFLQGQLITLEDVGTISTETTTIVNHTLGYPHNGWIILDMRTTGAVFALQGIWQESEDEVTSSSFTLHMGHEFKIIKLWVW